MTDTEHTVEFQAAGLDWTAGVAFNGEGFSVQWVSQLDSPTEISGGSLDLLGVLGMKRISIYGDVRYDSQSLRSLAHAAAELHRDRIEVRHRDDMDGARMDHAERRNEA